MVKTLSKHGNSLALILDRAILELLHIERDTQLELSTDGQSLIVTPITDPAQKLRFEEALERANLRYGPLLQRLAE